MERGLDDRDEISPLPLEAALGEVLRERAAEEARLEREKVEAAAQLEREKAEAKAREDHWHELLSTRYVCEACLTRYFMKYRKCKACGEVGRIKALTATLLELADDDGELREMIANGQVFGGGAGRAEEER